MFSLIVTMTSVPDQERSNFFAAIAILSHPKGSLFSVPLQGLAAFLIRRIHETMSTLQSHRILNIYATTMPCLLPAFLRRIRALHCY